MQTKRELQKCITQIKKNYDAFYSDIDGELSRIPLLNYIEKSLKHKYKIRTVWNKNSPFYIIN